MRFIEELKKNAIDGAKAGLKEAKDSYRKEKEKNNSEYSSRKNIKEKEIKSKGKGNSKENKTHENKADKGLERKDILNTVIDGVYKSSKVENKKGDIYIGKIQVSDSSCISCDYRLYNDVVKTAKKRIDEFKKHSLNPKRKWISEEYMEIRWRDGEKSILCVDSTKYKRIKELLS